MEASPLCRWQSARPHSDMSPPPLGPAEFHDYFSSADEMFRAAEYPSEHAAFAGADVSDYPVAFAQHRGHESGYEELSYSRVEADEAHYAASGWEEANIPAEGSRFRRTAGRPPTPRSPLRIVCIGPSFQVGGVRQHALALARFLDPARACITEFVVTEAPQAPRPGHARAWSPAVTFADDATLKRVSQECDVLLMWGTGFNDRNLGDRPLRIFLAHGESPWTGHALQESSRVVDHVIAVSDRVRRAVCQGFPTTTILNGVDSARLTQTADRTTLRRRFAFGDHDFVVGSVGRLTREKQFHLLIEAVARLPQRFKLLLAGSGRRQGELLELANRRIPGRFAIIAAHDYLGDCYAAMDAFGLVSAHEGFGLVLAEAMMCGTPVFSTRVGCAPEVLQHCVNGVLVDPHPESIAQALKLMQANPRWTRGLADEGRHFAQRHLHAARMARDYEDLLLRLHAERHRK